MSEPVKPPGLDSGIALSEWRDIKDTPAGRLHKQMRLHEMVMCGAVSLDEARMFGYVGAAQPDPFYAMLLTLRDLTKDALGYCGYVSTEDAKDLAVALVAAGWTPPVSLGEEP